MNASFWGGVILIAGGTAATLYGHFGWGFLALAAGFALALGRFTREAAPRYGGALVAAGLGLVLLMPLRDGGARPEPPAPSPTPPPVEASPEPARPGAVLEEQARRAIYQEIVDARARAEREAVAANPDGDSISPSNPAKMVRRTQKRAKVAAQLEEKYRQEIAARHEISAEQLAEIAREGAAQAWGGPP